MKPTTTQEHPVYSPQPSSRNVARHYDARRTWTREERAQSASINIRQFNNCVKSILIGHYVSPDAVVLDLCGGRGGDLNKFHHAHIQELVLVDGSADSIAEARRRYDEGRRRSHGIYTYPAQFHAVDCFSRDGVPLSTVLQGVNHRYDVVNCQFALHYAFHDYQTLDSTLAVVSASLKSRGVFLGVITNSAFVLKELNKKTPPNPNRPFNLRIAEKKDDNDKDTEFAPPSRFGQYYYFSLVDALDEVPEPIAHADVLEECARKHGLRLEKLETMRSFFNNARGGRHKQLIKRMKVLNRKGRVASSAWETAQMYSVFVFRKVKTHAPIDDTCAQWTQ